MLKFNWLKIFWIIVIILAIALVIKSLEIVKTWNDLILYIIGFTILFCTFAEAIKKRNNTQGKESLICVSPKVWTGKGGMLGYIAFHMFILSLIVIPCAFLYWFFIYLNR